jgi:hypothetical protein
MAVVALFGIVLLVPRNEGVPSAYKAALRTALVQGPGQGSWRIRELWGERTRQIAPHPEDPERVLVARRFGDKCVVQPWSRRIVSTFFSSGSPSLFLRNYAPVGEPTPDTLPDGTRTTRIQWRPLHGTDGDTSRWVWFEEGSLEVVRLEDRSWDGHLIHAAERTSRAAPDVESKDCTAPERGSGPRGPMGPPPGTLRPIEEAPFPVPEFTYVPPGFERVASHYHEMPVLSRERGRKIRMASMTYSDGFAVLSVGVASREDTERMEQFFARMRDKRSDPEACPTLPERSAEWQEGDVVVRRRADRCHTVVRRDDVGGMTVTVMGRNELAPDEYVRVIVGMEAPAAPSDR